MQRLTTSRNTSNTTENDTFTTATSHPERKQTISSKRKLGGCKCRLDCKNKRCGCFSLGDKCSSKCHCSDACKNGKQSSDNDDKENDESGGSEDSEQSATQATAERSLERTPPKVNTSTGNNDVSKDAESTFAKPTNPAYLTPKMARLSTISFDLPSAKKKFFE
uniref:Chromosome-associated kinesin KIF4 n=1 Tax=Zeugodacus cucurbitae TaxID=28588 RepID=A0A0A1WI97_ZEUCU